MARSSARGLSLLLTLLTACSAPAQPPPPLPGDRLGQTPAGQQAGTVSVAAPAKAEPAPPPPEPVRAAPTRPAQLWPFTRFRGLDYVAVRDIAKRYGLKAAWTKAAMEMTLSDARGVRFTFKRDERDFYLDGARVFLGDLTYLSGDDLWVPKLDVIKTIAPIFAPADHAAFLPAPPKTIVLDPGHGGTDPGKQNLRRKLDEKDMTLDVASRLKKLLEARGYRVVMTRTTDKRFSNNPVVDLPLRAEVANKEHADLFLSIHFNAVDREPERVSGTETYVLTPQFQVSTQPEQDKAMVQTRYPGNKQDMANALLGYMLHRQLITDLKTSDRGYKRYRLAVLRTLSCPGVLVESAYLSNDAEARRVATPEFRQQIAEAMAEGVSNYAAALAALRPAPPPVKP
ncbi:N-acetylmuramoyl-L-alanine amidase [Opitutus sp. GAS368]|uniref:N-acetylmuramoyl-L-alanine amidase family protein n=1 Tax=Opitutus sp. GAS368 TaxID=1882749 RepID=UPI00087A4380|nr:N-acetylmuramoyl-L-alanine amidase [Opitutus sp. GAS368]SDS15426.1 N-acetylmuramoyl-L-alanine amidase [Opitutus sp. GAS368]